MIMEKTFIYIGLTKSKNNISATSFTIDYQNQNQMYLACTICETRIANCKNNFKLLVETLTMITSCLC